MTKSELKALSQVLVFLLMLIAAGVALILAFKQNAWVFIIAYWITLTAKNFVDLAASATEDDDK